MTTPDPRTASREEPPDDLERTGQPGRARSDRLGLRELEYPIPDIARTLRYTLGALTLVSFVVLVVTGAWLTQFYNPDPAGAHDSVLYIIGRAPFGDLARNLHYWAASAMVVSIVAHIAWVFYRRAYRAPRELTWYAGVGMAALVFLMVVTGTILRWDQEGYEALAHFMAGGELAGAFGAIFTRGFTPSTPVLARIFAFHTSLLPLGIAALLGVHLWLIRALGISATGPASASFRDDIPRIAGAGLLLFAALLALAVLAPEGLGYRPVPGVEITKPFWPVLWIYALESIIGMWAMIWAPLVVFIFLVAVPLIDRGADRDGRVRGLRIAAGALLLALIALGTWAAIAPPQQHLGM